MQNKFKKLSVLLFLLAFSASVFAALILGNSIYASSFADNPEHVLSEAGDYAVLKFSDSNIFCPPSFDKNGSVCGYNGNQIRGWLIVDFTSARSALDVNAIYISHAELNLNCSDCNFGAEFKVFTTKKLPLREIDLNGGYTFGAAQWIYRGSCSASNDQNFVICSKTFSDANVEGVLVGRSDYADSKPDPALHWIKVNSN